MSNRRRSEEDDEEALKWAALERLPTYDRVQKGVLHGILGDLQEIDLRKLRLQDRKELLNRFIKSADKHEEFLKKLKERMDRVSLNLPTIEVRYENINVQGEAYVGSRALPTISNSIFNVIEGVGHRLHILSTHKKKFLILRDVSGIIKPGRLTLLLGPPGSGKTTLLQALTGKLDPGVKFAGKVTYNGHEMHEFVPQRTSAYISQYDVHLPQLTVRETLEFSAKCQGVGTGYDMLIELLRREKELNVRPDPYIDALMKASVLKGHKEKIVTDYVLKILGLDVCADTIVGDAMRRGVSGGQKKRVTTEKALRTTYKKLHQERINDNTGFTKNHHIVSFRCIAALSRDHIVSNTAGCLALMWLLVFSGFILSRENMHKWLIWGYWTSPLMYVQTAISVNEFLGQAWNRPLNGTNETLGVAVLRARGVFTSSDWYWIGVIALVGFILLFNGVSALAFAYLDEYGKSQAAFLSEESAKEDNVQTDKGNGTLLNKTNSKTKKASRIRSYQDKGMLLPFVPHTVTFDNITYSVDMPTGMKAQGVLDDRLHGFGYLLRLILKVESFLLRRLWNWLS
ncbi:hypothetical protein V6N13_107228 [Hibiscus sabdariffa]